jgi:hypothetical protein
MKRGNQFCPRFEELEQRAVPATHLTGCNVLFETIHGHYSRLLHAHGDILGGLLHGQVTISDNIIFSDVIFTRFSGTMTITTQQGKIRIENTGTEGDASFGRFSATGTITGGTGRYKGVSGTVTLDGILSGSPLVMDAALIGMICGPPSPSS